jgi:hypothetical protein
MRCASTQFQPLWPLKLCVNQQSGIENQQQSQDVNICNKSYENGRFEVLAVVVMKRTVFWDITLCSPLKVNRCFGGTYHRHLQGQRIS